MRREPGRAFLFLGAQQRGLIAARLGEQFGGHIAASVTVSFGVQPNPRRHHSMRRVDRGDFGLHSCEPEVARSFFAEGRAEMSQPAARCSYRYWRKYFQFDD